MSEEIFDLVERRKREAVRVINGFLAELGYEAFLLPDTNDALVSFRPIEEGRKDIYMSALNVKIIADELSRTFETDKWNNNVKVSTSIMKEGRTVEFWYISISK